MKAWLLQQERIKLGEDRFADVVIWQVPHPVRGSEHGYKYRLALVVNEICVLRYDNESGKGDHKHVDGVETPYSFTSLERLVVDFWYDVTKL